MKVDNKSNVLLSTRDPRGVCFPSLVVARMSPAIGSRLSSHWLNSSILCARDAAYILVPDQVFLIWQVGWFSDLPGEWTILGQNYCRIVLLGPICKCLGWLSSLGFSLSIYNTIITFVAAYLWVPYILHPIHIFMDNNFNNDIVPSYSLVHP